MALISEAPSEAHRACMDALKAALGKHGAQLSAVELLALVSQLVGNLVALQDQRVMTVDMCSEIIRLNIEEGNRQAVQAFLGTTHGNA